jgi:hypothetical protein
MKASAARVEFDDLSSQIRNEIESFEQLKVVDFQKAIQQFLTHYLSYQEEV